jgi:hypothetical protein
MDGITSPEKLEEKLLLRRGKLVGILFCTLEVFYFVL